MPEAAAPPTDRPAPPTAPATGGDREQATDAASLAARVQAAASGLTPLVAQAESVRAERARAYGTPRWTDVFTTQFTEFSNRPR
jgi:hypothetical protein